MMNLRSKRTRIAVAGLAVLAMTLSACSSSKNNSSGGGGGGTGSTPAKKTVKVGLAYDVGGRGDKSFNDLAAAGLEKAKADLNIQTKELSAVQGESDQQKADRLTLLATAGYNPIVAIGFAYAGSLAKVAPKFPNIHFGIIDDNSSKLPNVEGLVFAENESSFLVGVAAAQATKKKNVGFIGGVQTPLIQKFQAGYAAGVKAVDPSIKVQVAYISQAPDFSGFNDPAKAKVIAEGMYDGGADVVYHAAGGSGSGLFQAAAAKKALAIGVDSDQYQTATADQKPYILTSALKGVDTAVDNFIKDDAAGKFKAGSVRFDLKAGGVGYATSNPIIDPYKAKIEDFKAKIIAGTITVPTTP
ncbi:MAG: basic rane protein [Pseudonocardiales bacterium]|jgi:basic membrane protein A|nr:basic rane lipoprotein [Pseudonocardiales bacterium]MDT4971710.1 basic rane protein [Pseudonocardiales bacterium]MDT4981466.1 basic rane protein [Pseudonocardiales bacterium]